MAARATHIGLCMANRTEPPTPRLKPGTTKQANALSAEEFAVQFQSSWKPLWCIATAVVADRTLADDVLQEAAMVALGKLEQFDPRSNFTAWMGQIVRFVGLNHARRRTRS